MIILTISMLFVYILLVAYILWRSVHCIKNLGKHFNLKRVYVTYSVGFVLFCSTLLLGGLLPKGAVKTFFHKSSNYWLGFFIFFFFFMVCADILVFILKLIDRKREVSMIRRKAGYRIIALSVLILTIIFTTVGLVHARHLKQRDYDIVVEKDCGDIHELKIVLISDLHIGYSIGPHYLEKMVEAINEQEPDLVAVAGDIYDNQYEAIQDPERCAEILRGIKSKYGTYAVYGNHDVDATLIGGFTVTANEDAYRDPLLTKFCEDSGFKMLEDAYELIDDSFYIVGRNDLELKGDGTSDYEEISALTGKLDKTKPIICITHEPDELDETAQAGVDVLLCGHTHAGQFFPLTVVQPFRFRNYWGYLKIDDMHNIVTSGVGVYGPNLRLFTDSEIAVINVSFDK